MHDGVASSCRVPSSLHFHKAPSTLPLVAFFHSNKKKKRLGRVCPIYNKLISVESQLSKSVRITYVVSLIFPASQCPCFSTVFSVGFRASERCNLQIIQNRLCRLSVGLSVGLGAIGFSPNPY